MDSQEHYSRITNSSFYRDIALENYYKVVELNQELMVLKQQMLSVPNLSNEPTAFDYQLMKLERFMEMHATTTVVFSAMALEAFIYDYAAINLSDSFAKDHLDKMEFSSKWIIIPQLITGKAFPKDRLGFQQLKELIQIRNKLMHFKSTKLTPEKFEAMSNDVTDLLEYANKGIQAMVNIGKDLETLDAKSIASFQLGIIPKDELPWNQ